MKTTMQISKQTLTLLLNLFVHLLPTTAFTGVLKGNIAKDLDDGPHFQGDDVQLGMRFVVKDQAHETVAGLTITWYGPPLLEFKWIRKLRSNSLPSVWNRNDERTIKFENFNNTYAYPGVKINAALDPRNISQPGKKHNLTTWFRARYTLIRNQIHSEELEQWFPCPQIFYTPNCRGFGSLHSLLKESHYSSSSLLKGEDLLSGRSPFYSRINKPTFWTTDGDRSRSKDEFITVEFVKKVCFEMLAVKRFDEDRLKSFRLYISDDEIHWKIHPYKGTILTFPAHYDYDKISIFAIDPPVKTRFLRINPNAWIQQNKMKFDLYGCILDNVTTKSPLDFGEPLGLESGKVQDDQLSSSSSSYPGFEPFKARLNSGAAWCMQENSYSEYLQIDLLTPHVIQQIATQDKYINEHFQPMWSVKLYYLRYSLDGSEPFEYYRHNGVQKIFLGNLVANVAVKHRLIRPITARYVRFEAKEFLVRICMRIELYGKKVDDLNFESPPVLKRSFLVVPDTGKVFFCNADVVSKSPSPRERNVNYCFYLSRRDSELLMDWIGLGAKILSILGYDTSTKTVYGVGANRKTYVKSPLDLENEVRPLQNRLVYGITEEEWIRARDCNSTILATEVPFIPFHEGAKLPSGSFQYLIIKDKSNNQWGVSSAGLHFNQTLIASWNANERDKCEPNRCKNGGTCVDLYHSFRCECISGYSGYQCQEVFDPCSYPRCYSGASCRTTRFMSFVCDCPAGLTGHLCQQAEVTSEEVHSNISILTERSGVANSNNSTMHDRRFTVQINYSRFDIYYDKTSDGTGWILIARFSNSDAKNWVKFSGSWWYDVTEAQGNSIDPSDNADMISPAFWLISGRKFKITRSDDPLHTPLLQTTGDCLEGKSFRHKMLKYGFFRYGAVWARRRCQDDCEVNYGWPNETTYGFKQAKCDGPLQSSDKIGFWCDWESGGSVMMVGGGGGTCGGSDHGIGITEKNGGASFHNMEHKFDFGNDANPLNNGTTKNYSLNLWIN